MRRTIKPLAEVADFCLGKMLDGKKNRGEALPYLANINVRWGEFDLDNIREMRFEHDEMDRYGLKYGDIVMCEGGEPGRCAIWKEPVPGMMIQKALHRIRPQDSLDYRFLFYSFLHKGRNGEFAPLFTGSTIKHLPREKLAKVEIAYPRLEVQSRIADILSAYDDLIENNRRRMALLEDAARQLYREWFVRLRFPGYEHTRITNGVPEGWERRRLDQCILVLEAGNRPKGGVYDISEGVPSIGAESIVGVGRFDFGATKYVPEDYFSRLRKGVIRDRDVLVYKDGGRPGYFTPHVSMFGGGFPFDRMALNSHVYRVRGAHPISQEFLYCHLSSESILSWMNRAGSGAAIPGIARKDLLRLPVLVASNRIMEVFTEVAATDITQILKLALVNRKLQEARDLLLPRLMSGEIVV